MREIVREETARQSAIIAAIRRAVLQLASVFADERKI